MADNCLSRGAQAWTSEPLSGARRLSLAGERSGGRRSAGDGEDHGCLAVDAAGVELAQIL